MCPDKIIGLNELIEPNKIVTFEKPITINGVKTYSNRAYVTLDEGKFNIKVYSDVNSVLTVDTVDYDTTHSAMNVTETDHSIDFFIYSKFE